MSTLELIALITMISLGGLVLLALSFSKFK